MNHSNGENTIYTGLMLLVIHDKDLIFDQQDSIWEPVKSFKTNPDLHELARGPGFLFFCLYKRNFKNQRPKINNRKKTKQKVTTTIDNEK